MYVRPSPNPPELSVKELRKIPVIKDWERTCRCGHYRYEHSRSFGCMNWDERKMGLNCWCTCDGFAPNAT